MISPPRNKILRPLVDLSAIAVLVLYGLLAWGSEGGRGGVTLDPVWAAARERGALRVAVDVGFRPFADQIGGALVGYDIDLARAVATRLGLRAEFVPTGFDALYDTLSSGRADMIASALPYAPEQGFRARFSSFYFDAGQVLVVRAGSAIAGPDDLGGRAVGVALGSDADALARRMARDGAGLNLRSAYDEPAQALADLRAGRLDAVITDNVAALAAVQSAPGLRIAAALTTEPFALAMPRAAFQLEAEVNQALADLRDEGFFDELNRRWLR
ncbi:MAG: amino acid ABC transporter substrate-binding protein [Chloroflexales bacterium]|nr:amino acid ABC transporter substrate-binding protein [Chloroflexales bacterium]